MTAGVSRSTRTFETRWISLGTGGLANDWDLDGISAAIDQTCKDLEADGYTVISVTATTSTFPPDQFGILDYRASATKFICVVGRRT